MTCIAELDDIGFFLLLFFEDYFVIFSLCGLFQMDVQMLQQKLIWVCYAKRKKGIGGNQIYASPSLIAAEILDLNIHCLEAVLVLCVWNIINELHFIFYLGKVPGSSKIWPWFSFFFFFLLDLFKKMTVGKMNIPMLNTVLNNSTGLTSSW